MIDANGDYILKGRSFKNSSFFEFYKSYNPTDPESSGELFARITSSTGSAPMLNSHGQECVLAFTPISATSGWTLLGFVPAEDLHVDAENWLLVGVISAGLLILFLLFSVGYCEGESRNLLQNGDFAELDSEGLPAYWYTDAYFLNSGYSVFGASEGDDVHRHIITIQNIAENDARFAQSVAVEPETLYRLSGYIRADGVDGIHGANLSIEGIYAFSDECFNTEDEWEYIEYYGETGPEQRSIVVLARLGGYSGVSTGKASFADLSLTKVDSVPGDLIADRWYRETSYDFDDSRRDCVGRHTVYCRRLVDSLPYG